MSKEYVAIHAFPLVGAHLVHLMDEGFRHPVARPLLENLIEQGVVAKEPPHRFSEGLEYRYFVIICEQKDDHGLLIYQWRQQKKRKKKTV